MPKQLYVAFTTEGPTDETFLGILLRRILEDISRRHGLPYEVMDVVWLGGAKGESTVNRAIEAYESGAHLLFIHRDTDEHSYEFIFNNHIQPILGKIEEKMKAEMPIVPMIIKHEQETWMLADLDKLNEILCGKLDHTALNLPPDLETRSHAKELFKQAIRAANTGQRRGRGFQLEAVVELLANEMDLGRLGRLNGYRQFVANTESALQSIGYIR